MGFLLFTTSLQAQRLSPQTVHVAEGFSKAADFSFAYSVGEQSSISFYTTATASTLSEGFLQDFGFLVRYHLVLDLLLNNTSFEGSTRPLCLPGCADPNLRSRLGDGVLHRKSRHPMERHSPRKRDAYRVLLLDY